MRNEPPLGEPVPSPITAQRLKGSTLTGKFISLVPLDPERHAAELYACSHGSAEKERLWTYMSYGPFVDVQAMQRWLAEQAHSTDPLFFAVIFCGRAIGMVSFLCDVPAMRRLEIGHIWYAPDYQRSAVNTEAAYLMLRHAFEALGYRRVEWKCNALNERSRRAALRLGFQFEGVFRKHMIVKGRNRDSAWFAMTDDDWPSVRCALEAWLYAEGLDAFAKRPALLAAVGARGPAGWGVPRS